jgi:hypothetical protein
MLTGVLDERALDERGPVCRLSLADCAINELKLLLVKSKYNGVIGHVLKS